MKKKKANFNPAFKDLRERIERARGQIQEEETKRPPTPEAPQNDEDYFLKAISDVTPLDGPKRKILKAPQPNIKPAHPPPDDKRDGLNHLHRLLEGSIEMDISFSDEYIEGSVKGFSRKLMKRLKMGQFPVQDYIDLHGLTRQEAERAVRDFLVRSRSLGRRCVLIVHGRGLNSPDSFPVLKEGLPRWLSRGPVRKIVLAFATARPYDGGAGAIYVLLRKR
ncbi:MAG: Smr/MutS family protein [Deltaproteobacteria bacterium]|nr:Smr/MutS family protein [Deltaproteobacteria bacterium]MBW2137150.1 Smr/MutS family protein [Deltaproteobacteria bacterium]